jgi:hypothetical protein
MASATVLGVRATFAISAGAVAFAPGGVLRLRLRPEPDTSDDSAPFGCVADATGSGQSLLRDDLMTPAHEFPKMIADLVGVGRVPEDPRTFLTL